MYAYCDRRTGMTSAGKFARVQTGHKSQPLTAVRKWETLFSSFKLLKYCEEVNSFGRCFRLSFIFYLGTDIFKLGYVLSCRYTVFARNVYCICKKLGYVLSCRYTVFARIRESSRIYVLSFWSKISTDQKIYLYVPRYLLYDGTLLLKGDPSAKKLTDHLSMEVMEDSSSHDLCRSHHMRKC
jgi:hypothetical protein